MQKKDFTPKKWLVLSLLSIFILTLSGVSVVVGQETSEMASIPGRQVIIRYDPDAAPKPFTPPPAHFLQSAPAQTADIQVNYVGSWTTEAQTAFEYAVSIWESLIVSSVPIVVQAEFANLGPGILGGASPRAFYRNVANEPIANTWYPVAIANALEGSDINGSTPEIDSAFSSTFDWYYGTDGNTPINKIDFVSVVLHEIGHGLGFSGSMSVSGGTGSWGYSDGTGTFPTIYDRYTENGAGTSLILGFPNGSSTLAAQLTSNNIYFDGPNANAANGGRVPLYAPSTWQQGSSYSHLAESFNGTPNSLMTYSLGSGQAEHDPGPVTLGIFADLGWQVESMDTSPTIDTLPTVLIQTGTSQDNAIDLWAYVSDLDHDPDQLTYTITGQSDPTAGATIDGNRYLDVNPTDVNWVGSSIVTVTVTDPDAQADTADFKVVSGDITHNYLPLVTK